MIGKLPDCGCILEIDQEKDIYKLVSACDFHKSVNYTAKEVAAEHIALQLDRIKYKPIKRIKRWWNN